MAIFAWAVHSLVVVALLPLKITQPCHMWRACRSFFYLVFLMFLLTPCLGMAAENITVVSPQKSHVAGQPILFHIQPHELLLTQKAVVYYRGIGVSVYRKIDMTSETPVDFIANLSGMKAFPPGIEFFFVVTDDKDQVFTYPQDDPKKHPYRLEINLDKNHPQLLKHSPAAGVTITTTNPDIVLEFTDHESFVHPETVRFIVDEIDVTSLCKITRTTLDYSPARPLSPGSHSMAVEMSDISGNRMPPVQSIFIVASPAPVADKSPVADAVSAEVNISGEFRHEIAAKNDSDTNWRFQSALTMRTQAQKDQFKVSLDASANYIDEDAPGPDGENFNLDNFLLQLEYGKQLLALGDVSVEGTELISHSISRRGSRLALNLADTRIEAFALRSNYITGYKEGLGLSDSDQMLTGGFVEKDLLKDKKLTLKATYVSGRNERPEDYNASSLTAGTEGSIYSLLLKSRLFDEKLDFEGEYAGSQFDSDLSDDVGEKSDSAWRAKLSGRYEKLDGSVGYRYLGTDFRSIVNSTGANGREEYTVGGGIRFATSSLRFTGFHNQDNVDNDPLFPVMKNTTASLNYNLFITDWPSIYFNCTQSVLRSSDEPAGFTPMENHITTLGGGLSLSKNRWHLSPNYTYTTFDDRGETSNNDSRTHVASLSAGYRPTDFSSINPFVTYVNSKTDASGVTIETWQGALSGFVSLFENELNLNATLSALDTQSSDGASHTNTYSAVAQLNWQVQKYLLKKGRQTFSIRGQYSRTEDHIRDSSADDYAIYGVISFGIPIKLL